MKIFWPIDKQNSKFNFLILSNKNAFFCRITVGIDIDNIIKENLYDEKYTFSEELKSLNKKKIKVEYILVHEDETKKNKIEIDCYSFCSIGQAEYFDDEAMREIHKIKTKDKVNTQAEVKPSTSSNKRGCSQGSENKPKKKA